MKNLKEQHSRRKNHAEKKVAARTEASEIQDKN